MFLWGILRRESRCPEQFLTHLCSTFWDTLQKLLLGPSTKLCATWIHNQWENCLSKVHQHMDLREWEIFVGLNQCFILYCLRSKKKDKKCFCSLFFIQDYLLPSWKCLCYWGTSHSEEWAPWQWYQPYGQAPWITTFSKISDEYLWKVLKERQRQRSSLPS